MNLTRRGVLEIVGASLMSGAGEGTPAHSLGALLDSTGLSKIQAGEFQMGSNRGL